MGLLLSSAPRSAILDLPCEWHSERVPHRFRLLPVPLVLTFPLEYALCAREATGYNGVPGKRVCGESLCSLTYVGTMQHEGYWHMAKVDVKNAYRNVPVHPDDRWLMGRLWEGALFIDTALPFGLCSAPKIFTVIVHCRRMDCEERRGEFHHPPSRRFSSDWSPSLSEVCRGFGGIDERFQPLRLPVVMDKLEGPGAALVLSWIQGQWRSVSLRRC